MEWYRWGDRLVSYDDVSDAVLMNCALGGDDIEAIWPKFDTFLDRAVAAGLIDEVLVPDGEEASAADAAPPLGAAFAASEFVQYMLKQINSYVDGLYDNLSPEELAAHFAGGEGA